MKINLEREFATIARCVRNGLSGPRLYLSWCSLADSSSVYWVYDVDSEFWLYEDDEKRFLTERSRSW